MSACHLCDNTTIVPVGATGFDWCPRCVKRSHLDGPIVEPGIAHDDPSEGVPRYCLLFCPYCHTQHLDEGEWLERPHHKHLCLHCKKLWRVEPFCFGVADPQSNNSPTAPDPSNSPTDPPSK